MTTLTIEFNAFQDSETSKLVSFKMVESDHSTQIVLSNDERLPVFQLKDDEEFHLHNILVNGYTYLNDIKVRAGYYKDKLQTLIPVKVVQTQELKTLPNLGVTKFNTINVRDIPLKIAKMYDSKFEIEEEKASSLVLWIAEIPKGTTFEELKELCTNKVCYAVDGCTKRTVYSVLELPESEEHPKANITKQNCFLMIASHRLLK